MKTYFNWSGGKDSSIALYRMMEAGNTPELLLTSVNTTHNRISMHGVRRELLEIQALETGIPLETLELPEQPDMNTYNTLMGEKMNDLKKRGFSKAVFGDIFLEDLKKYREEKLAEAGIKAVFPLWKEDTRSLAEYFIHTGFKAIIVCVNERWLDSSFCGRELDQAFLNDLPKNVDPCGENGEFHSYVYAGPVFRNNIPVKKGELVRRTYPVPANNDADNCYTTPVKEQYGFYFQDLLL